MDLKAFLNGEAVRVKHRGIMGLAFTPPSKPLIAAVEGYALAGGFEVVLACDLLVAAKDAMFGLPEAKRGLAALAGGLLRLPRAVPPRIAMEMALTGEMVSAGFLERHGLINRLTEPGRALEEAQRLAAQIVVNAPMSVSASKRIIDEHQGRIRVETKVGQGSAFRVFLPADLDSRHDPSATAEDNIARNRLNEL